jgi:PAS domain S-box-containing protein
VSVWRIAPDPATGEVVLFVADRSELVRSEAGRLVAEAETTYLLENISDGFYAIDPQWRFTYANARASALFGRAPSELIGRSFFSVFPNLQSSVIHDQYTRAMEDQERRSFLSYSPVLRRWITFYVTPRGNKGLTVFFRDVSARKDVEEALCESEMRLRLFIDGAPAAIAMFDSAMCYLAVSRRFLMDSGLANQAPAGLIGRCHYDVFPSLAERWRPIHQRVLAGERLSAEDESFPRPDGTVDRVRWEMVPWRQADGTVGGALWFSENITARKLAEEALRDSESRLRLVQQVGGIAYSDRTRGTPAAMVSEEFARLYGLPAGQTSLSTAEWLALVHPDDHDRMVAELKSLDASWTTLATEFRIRRTDGSVRWVAIRAEAFIGSDGRPQRVVSAQRDITDIVEARAALVARQEELEARVTERTAELSKALDQLHREVLEREQAENQLRQSQKMEALGQLTGGIAHDFNNMLQAIGGNLELMHRRLLNQHTSDLPRYLDNAAKTVERASALTHRLLAFARRQALQPSLVNPNALIEGTAELIKRTVGPAISIELQLADDMAKVLCDPSQLENALLNVAINARDAMPEGGRITIRTNRVRLSEAEVANQEGANPGNYVEIAVTDTGTGMDEPTRGHAFEPFFTTKPLGQGTGLGLSQVYGFVRQTGGVVGLVSAPGRGTTVRLGLPLYETTHAHDEAPPQAAEPDLTDAGETVLLVEDEAGVRASVGERLRELGYQVMEAPNGHTALRLAASGARVDVLVTDVGLPGGLNGRQIADALREHRPTLPVLFITGYSGAGLAGELAPSMQVLGKPFAIDALAAAIQSMLERAPVA